MCIGVREGAEMNVRVWVDFIDDDGVHRVSSSVVEFDDDWWHAASYKDRREAAKDSVFELIDYGYEVQK